AIVSVSRASFFVSALTTCFQSALHNSLHTDPYATVFRPLHEHAVTANLILLGFYVLDQHTVVLKCDVERTGYIYGYIYSFFTNKAAKLTVGRVCLRQHLGFYFLPRLLVTNLKQGFL
ncbi:hypothetical protein ILYODFUR_020145, partial [Ilyodon furcidens]